MIVYGTRASETAKEFVPEKCPNCGSVSSIDMHHFQKYFHLFWIPFFPFEKTGVSQCDKCKHILKEEQMPPALKTFYYNLKKKTRTPVWMFAGLILVAVIISGVAIFEMKKNDKNATFIQAPQKGDIYEVRINYSTFTLYKVEYVEKDSVFVSINNYEANKSTGLSNIILKGDNAFSEDVYGFSKTTLKAMQATGDIMDIYR